MASAVDDAFGHDIDGIDMHSLAQNGRPVDHHATYDVALEYYVLHAIAVEDGGSSMHGMVEERGSALHGVEGIESILKRRIVDAKVANDVQRLLLDHNLVEHHRATPHSAAGRKLSVKLSYLQSCLGKVVCRHDTRGTTTNDGHVNIEIALQFVKISTDNSF